MIETVPVTADIWISSGLGFPGIFSQCVFRVSFTSPVAPTITGMISMLSNSQVFLRSFFKSWYLLTFSRSAVFSPKSFGTETSIILASFFYLSQMTISGLMAPPSTYLPRTIGYHRKWKFPQEQ